MAHLKRLLAPGFWKVSKKEKKWVVSPSPGPHQKSFSIPLSLVLTSILKIVDTTTEAKRIIKRGEIFVDGKRRRDHGYPVGLFDTVAIPRLNKYYRAIPVKKGLELIEIDEKEAKMKILSVNGKTALKKGKMQLNFHDGKNILVEKGNYNTGDSLLVELPSLKVAEHLTFGKGSLGIVARGADAGKLAKVKETVPGSFREAQKVVCVIDNEDRIIGKKNFVVIGKEKPVIKIAS